MVKVIYGQNHFWYYKVKVIIPLLAKEEEILPFYAIKAILTLHGEDAIRFRKEMEANERAFLSRTKRDRKNDPFVIKMREMLRKSGLR